MALRTVGVRLAAEVSGYVNNLRTAGAATKGFVGELDKGAKAGKLDAVADSAGRMALAMGGAAVAVVGMTVRFDKQMSEVRAVSGATAEQFEQLREAAIRAGKDTSFSATEAAQAQAELAKAGLSTAQILGGALDGALALAAAGSLDLAEAADIAAKTMNIFGLAGADVGHIADVLSASANKSATDVHEMGEALKMGGLAANAAGMSMEETVGTLSAFADNALNGSDAGTSLKTALMMLQAPTDKAASLMESLGINAYDTAGNFVGTAKLAGQLQKALGGLTQEQRNAALAQIFGADAMRAANVLYTVGEQGINDYTAAVNDSGAAAETARLKTDNLAGDIERLTGSLESLAISAGTGSTSGLRTLVQTLDNLISSVSNIPGPVQTLGVTLLGVGGAVLGVGAGMIKMRNASANALEALSNIGPAGERAAKGIGRVGAFAGKAAIALTAMNVASAALGSSMNPQVDALGRQLAEFAKSGEVGSEMARLFGDDLGKLDMAMKDVADTGMWSSFSRGSAGFIEGISGMGNVVDSSLQHSKERLEALDQALTQLVQAGKVDEAKAAFDQIAQAAADQGVSVKELSTVLPGYTAAVDGAGSASDKAAGGISKVGAEAGLTAEQVQQLKAAFDELFDRYMDADEAAIKYQQGLINLNKELSSGAHTLSLNSEEGLKNRQAVLDQIQVIKDQRDARIRNNMTIDEANGKYESEIGALRKTLRQMGYNKTEIDALIGKYKQIPAKVNTQVTTNTTQASAAVTEINKKIASLKSKHIQITVDTVLGQSSISLGNLLHHRWGGIDYHMAAGGALQAAVVGSPTVLFGERETGAEAFVPKNGDRNRSLGILNTAASWYGAQVMPARYVPAARAGAVNVALALSASAAPGANRELVSALVSVLRFEVQRVGGVARLLEQPA